MEVLAAAGLLAVAAAFLVPALGGVQSYLYKMQAQRAAQLQQYCFYDVSGRSRLEMDTDKGGYRIYHGKDKFLTRRFSADSGLYFNQHFNALQFSQEGAPSITVNYIIKCRHDKNRLYFNQHFNALQFSQEGAPSITVNYIIKCRHDKNISYWLQVQPVTGRVVFK